MKATVKRLLALSKKEFYQLKRDRGSILLGIFLPIVLIFLIGSGLSLDVKNVKVAVALEDSSPTARDTVSFLNGSEYFSPRYVYSRFAAQDLLIRHDVDAAIIIANDFSRELYRKNGSIELLLNGTETTNAMMIERYVSAGLQQNNSGGVVLVSRLWYNDENTSTFFFIPGILMLILTICGTLLTAVVMAREWERGTFEAIFVSPVAIYELTLAKVIPYFVLAMAGFSLSLLVGHFYYALPMRGSLLLIIGVSMLFLIVMLGFGLTISAITRSQFLACQVALTVSFLPTIMLSGFLFDLNSAPPFIQFVSKIFPMTYYLATLKMLLLAGNYLPLLIKNTIILIMYALVFIGIAIKLTRKRVD